MGISNSTNNKNHYHMKHINIKYHFVKQRIKCGQVIFDYISFANNIADLFMKLLLWDAILKFVRKLGLCQYQNTLI